MLLHYLDVLGDVEASEAKCMHFLESIDAEQTQPSLERVQDLEDTVLSLKQLLTDRDKELELVQCEKRKMEVEVRELRDREKSGITPLGQGGIILESQKETEKRINDLIREKENMATEIWQLKRDLDKAAKGQHNHLDNHSVSHDDNLDASNTRVLHRKIEELESRVKDLQEVNETTAGNLVHTEKELDQLKKDNEALRKNRNRKIIELEDDNTYLKQQLEQSGGGVSGDHYLRLETEKLREDLRILRDKNHQLVQDNIKLTEHLKDLEAQSDIATSRRGGDSQGERGDLVAECQRYRKEREAALEEVDYLRRELQKSRREGSLNRSLDRDPYQHEVKLRAEDNTQNSLSQSVYRSHTVLVNGHGEAGANRERKHSGSDLSDSTAVLTSALPGYNSDKDTLTDTRKSQGGKEADKTDRFLDGSDQLSPAPDHNSSLRSVNPKPITTQHNKHLRSSPVADEVSQMVANKRPFCPRNPADLHLGDLVKFSSIGGKISRGYVKYIGHLLGKHDTYLGVELEHATGRHDGTYEGHRYFHCKPNKGVFVNFKKVEMAVGS